MRIDDRRKILYSVLDAIYIAREGTVRLKLRVREIAEAQGIKDAAALSRRANIAYATAHRLWIGNLGSDQKGIGVLVLYRVARALEVRFSELMEEVENGSGQLTAALATG